jgi:hypothetical protein
MFSWWLNIFSSLFEALFWKYMVSLTLCLARQGHCTLQTIYVHNNRYFRWRFYFFHLPFNMHIATSVQKPCFFNKEVQFFIKEIWSLEFKNQWFHMVSQYVLLLEGRQSITRALNSAGQWSPCAVPMPLFQGPVVCFKGL